MRRLALAALLAGALVALLVVPVYGAASQPKPTHGIGTAVLKYNWRGGHAIAPAHKIRCSA